MTPRKLPCGCCLNGCICEEHAYKTVELNVAPPTKGRRYGWVAPTVCPYHQIENRFDDDMRAVFGNRVQEDGL